MWPEVALIRGREGAWRPGSARHSFYILGTLHLCPLQWLSQRAKRGGESKRSNFTIRGFLQIREQTAVDACFSLTSGWTVSTTMACAQRSVSVKTTLRG